MKIAGKLNALFIAAALVLGCFLILFSAHREYQADLEELVTSSLAKVMSRPDLQLRIYKRDTQALQHIIEDFREPRTVALAAVYDSLGELLARSEPGTALPGLATLRADVSPTEVALTAPGPEGKPIGVRALVHLAPRTLPPLSQHAGVFIGEPHCQRARKRGFFPGAGRT